MNWFPLLGFPADQVNVEQHVPLYLHKKFLWTEVEIEVTKQWDDYDLLFEEMEINDSSSTMDQSIVCKSEIFLLIFEGMSSSSRYRSFFEESIICGSVNPVFQANVYRVSSRKIQQWSYLLATLHGSD